MDIKDCNQTWVQVIERNYDGRPSFLMYEKIESKLAERVSITDMMLIGKAYDVRVSQYNASSFASIPYAEDEKPTNVMAHRNEEGKVEEIEVPVSDSPPGIKGKLPFKHLID